MLDLILSLTKPGTFPTIISHHFSNAVLTPPPLSKALDRADLLVNAPQGMSRLDSVWGAGGARRPVRALVAQMVQLLREFLSSADCEEAIRWAAGGGVGGMVGRNDWCWCRL